MVLVLAVDKVLISQQSSFPLIQLSYVKFTKLAQFDKTSDACQWMELVNV